MKQITITLLALAALVGCGGANGGGSTTPPPDNKPPHGLFTGQCRDVGGEPYGCWLKVDGETVEWGLQAGTGGLPGTLKRGVLSVGPYDDYVNVSQNRIWLVGRIDVIGGER